MTQILILINSNAFAMLALFFQANQKKLDPCVKSNIFLGLYHITKGYITYGLENLDIKITRNLVFYDNDFPNITYVVTNDLHLSLPLHDSQPFYDINQSHDANFNHLFVINDEEHTENKLSSPRRSTRIRHLLHI